MAKLRHPNIVQLLAYTTHPAAMITEFCAKGSLSGKCALTLVHAQRPWCTGNGGAGQACNAA